MSSQDYKKRYWGVVKAIAYELRPFPMPTKEDLKMAVVSGRTNVEQLLAEARRLAPEVWDVVKGLKPLSVLIALAWLCGWAGFVWLEFGESWCQ